MRRYEETPSAMPNCQVVGRQCSGRGLRNWTVRLPMELQSDDNDDDEKN